jgi:hypothetical protein
VSTFQQNPLADDNSLQPSTVFTPKIVSQNSSASNFPTFSIPKNVDQKEEEDGSISKISDTESRISSLEEQFFNFTSTVSLAKKDLHRQSKKQAKKITKCLHLLWSF